MTHLWKHIWTLGERLVCETFTLIVLAYFFKCFSLDKPCISTLLQSILVPGFEPGDFSTGTSGKTLIVALVEATAERNFK